MTTAGRGRPRHYDLATELQMLLDAAVSVMKRNDFHDATLNDILDEAGLSTRAFYRHFTSKSELIMAIHRRDAERATVRIRNRMAAADTPWEAVRVWVEEMLSTVFDSRRAQRLAMLDAAIASSDRVVADHDYFVQIMSAPLLEALEQGLADGSLPATDPAADAVTIYAICTETIRRCRDGRFGFSREEAVEHVMRFCRAAALSVAPSATPRAVHRLRS
ncbi:TetR/AcrR family transcriptional regulator [Jatrophihabitans sp. DSM 45814]